MRRSINKKKGMEGIGRYKPIHLQINKTKFSIWLSKKNKITTVENEKERYWTLLIKSRLLIIIIFERYRYSWNLKVNCLLIKAIWIGRKLRINKRMLRKNRINWKMDSEIDFLAW